MQKQGFFDRVYKIVKQIPEGKVATYGQIAALCGNKRASRAVGYALHVNPEPIVIPCHRVVNRKGELASSFAFGGKDVQKDLLLKENIEFSEEYIVNMTKHVWNCDLKNKLD